MATTISKRLSARERLLAAGDELFYAEGVHTVGIDRVIEKAGVAKGSLYYTFGSKDELVRAYLENRHAAWMARIDAGIEAHDDPTGRLLAVFDVLGDLFSEPGFRGCAFANAVAEARPDGPEERATAEFRSWLHGLFARLAEGTGVDHPKVLADQLVLLYDGANAAAQMDKSAAPARTAHTIAALLVAAA